MAGRALTIAPALRLPDEPLSGLDARPHPALGHELRTLPGQWCGAPAALVPHDSAEADRVARRIVVGEGGG